MIAAFRRRSREAQTLALWTAWHVAAISRTERLPELAPMLARVSGEADDGQSDETQFEMARAIAAFMAPAPEK